jgi:hypothetical protein
MPKSLYKTRNFNQITELLNGAVLEKRSTNVDKLRSEYRYYYACNTIMQRYMVKPFSFKVESGEASYRMHNLKSPDLGYLYANEMLTEDMFKTFLNSFDIFRKSESAKPFHPAESYSLVVRKAKTRILDMYGGTLPQDKRDLIHRLDLAYNHYNNFRLTSFARPSHGDPCLSNVVITKSGHIKMFDPKGIEFFYLDEYYDIAKISQSIHGGYEHIIHDRANFVPQYQSIFEKYLDANKINIGLLRVYEASLFISMCPMHQDRPDHIDRFFNTADKILKEVNF